MFLLRISVLKGVISFICSFYLALLLQSHFNFSQPFFLFTGLILFAIFSYTYKFLSNKLNATLIDNRVAFISIGIAVLIMLAFGRKINPAIEPDGLTLIKITALGEKNDSSHANEVWINQIKNDQIEYDLNRISLPNGWEKKYNCLVSYQQQPASLEIKIEDPVKPSILFQMHSWSGKVKIQEGNKTIISDLYKGQAAGSYVYTSDTIVHNKKKLTATKILITVTTFLALCIFSYISLLFAKGRNNFFLLSGPLCILIYFLPDHAQPELVIKLLLLAISIAATYIMQKPGANEFINTFIKPNKKFFSVIVIYSGFAFLGYQLFLSNFPVNNVISKIAYLLIFNCWLALIAVSFLYATYLCKTKLAARPLNSNSSKPRYSSIYLYLIFLSILLAFWSIYLIAFFPANMTSDSLDQWGQATGVYPLFDAHPIFHTLLNRLIISIARTPAILSISQMIFLGAVCSSFLLFLHKTGIPLKWLIVSAILIGVVPANGITVITLWKDIPYACSILWITLVLAQIISKKYLFTYKTTLFSLGVSLIFVALIRHNGIPTVLLIAAMLIALSIKERKKEILYSVLIPLVFVFGFKTITPSLIPVKANWPGLKIAPPIHGIASVIYYNGKLTKETQQEMEKLLPVHDWKKFYYPYSSDKYFFQGKRTFIDDLTKISTGEAMKIYFNTFIDNPYLIIRDRLSGTDLLWNVSQPKEAFNGRFAPEIGDNTFGFKQNNSALKDTIIKVLSISVEKADALLWRAGIYNILLFFLIILIKYRKRNILVFLPFIGNYLSLLIAMMHQDFRYIYSIPLVFIFIWLFIVSDALSIPDIKNSVTKNKQ